MSARKLEIIYCVLAVPVAAVPVMAVPVAAVPVVAVPVAAVPVVAVPVAAVPVVAVPHPCRCSGQPNSCFLVLTLLALSEKSCWLK